MRVVFASDPAWLDEALRHLRGGGVLALPTETVYGFAASLDVPEGVERICQIKARPAEKALPWQVHSLEAAFEAGFRFSRYALRLAERFWPGPLTLILDRPTSCPEWFAPEAPTIALRIPDHLATSALLLACAAPLAVTSANRSGTPECLDAGAVLRAFGGHPELLVVDGGTVPGGLASTVVDASGEGPLVLRGGPIPFERILEALHET